MADQQPEQTDPVADLLRKYPIGNSVRHDAWDAFDKSKDEDELASTLKAMPLPTEAKRALWDLKYKGSQLQAQNSPKNDKGETIYSNRPTTLTDVAQGISDFRSGVVKQMGRLAQDATSAMTGVDYPSVTDKFYGLPPGASAKVMQPANKAETYGGIAADVGETLAGGAAEGGMVYTRGALGRFTAAPFRGTVAGNAARAVAEPVSDIASGAFHAARADLLGGGPVTAEKVGGLVYKFGRTVAKGALISAGLAPVWYAWEKLK